jgi:hypothetical protein
VDHLVLHPEGECVAAPHSVRCTCLYEMLKLASGCSWHSHFTHVACTRSLPIVVSFSHDVHDLHQNRLPRLRISENSLVETDSHHS